MDRTNTEQPWVLVGIITLIGAEKEYGSTY